MVRSEWPIGLWQIVFCFAATSLGAWLCVLPFLKDYQVASKLAESNALSTALAQIKNLEEIQKQISTATGQWISVQDNSAKAVAAAGEISERMTKESDSFRQFMEKANESERSHLRLEVEKLQRAQGDWLQVLVRIMDHIYALNQAGARSGQPALISQLIQFQHACRDAARRVGLAPVAADRYDTFDPKVHQLANSKEEAPPNAQVTEVLAIGYSYQGNLIRKALVSVSPEPQTELAFSTQQGEEETIEDVDSGVKGDPVTHAGSETVEANP